MTRDAEYHVIFIRKEEAGTRLYVNELSRWETPVFRVHVFERAEEALRELSGGSAHALVLDGSSDDSARTLAHVRGQFPEIPVVALASSPDDEFAREADRSGAFDCLVKSAYLPGFLARSLMDAAQHAQTHRPAKAGRKRILLIDDDESLLQLLNRRLDHSGYEVLQARDGREGLEAARRGWPDLIILDLRLPGYTGEEVCKAIREDGDKEFARTPIIMLTGKTADVDRVIGMVIGANYYLTKPFRSQDLLRKVRTLIGGVAHVA